MFTREHTHRARRTLAHADAFTPEERAQLEALRARYADTHDCGEFGLDERRLRYVRWLVEHGCLSEHIKRVLLKYPAD